MLANKASAKCVTLKLTQWDAQRHLIFAIVYKALSEEVSGTKSPNIQPSCFLHAPIFVRSVHTLPSHVLKWHYYDRCNYSRKVLGTTPLKHFPHCKTKIESTGRFFVRLTIVIVKPRVEWVGGQLPSAHVCNSLAHLLFNRSTAGNSVAE